MKPMLSSNVLTPQLKKTYQFIQHFIQEHGIAPTQKEIAEGIGIRSRGVVHRYVHQLAQEGLLTIIPNKRRNIQLMQSIHYSSAELILPVVNQTTTHSPKPSDNNEKLDISSVLLGSNRFVLKIADSALCMPSLHVGDYLICEHRQKLQKTDPAVVIIEDKILHLCYVQHHSNNTATLAALYSSDDHRTYPNDDIAIQGAYLGMIRIAQAPDQDN